MATVIDQFGKPADLSDVGEDGYSLEMKMTQRQSQAWECLDIDNMDIDEVLYGGAKGGGKSVLACVWAYVHACTISARYVGRGRRQYPIPVGWMGRKVAKHFKDTTLETWKRIIPEKLYALKGDPAEIILDGGRVKIVTGGLDSRESMEKFNSAEYAFIVVDQAEETTEDDVAVLRASLRLIINGHRIKTKALFTANPRQCWLKREFVSASSKNKRNIFIPALPGDNPHLSERYIDVLRRSFKHRPELIQAYLYGSWTSMRGAQEIIDDAWLELATQRGMEWPYIKRYLACDPARYGDDETVIMQFENCAPVEMVIHPYGATTQTSGKLAAMSREDDDCPVVVESTGGDVGAGIIDELRALDVPVLQFNPAAAAFQPDNYINLRAEAWFTVAKKLADGLLDEQTGLIYSVGLPALGGVGWDELLREQLCTVQYEFRGRKVKIESKEELRKRLGGASPDRADCYIIGVFAWPWIKCKEERELRERYHNAQAREGRRERRYDRKYRHMRRPSGMAV